MLDLQTEYPIDIETPVKIMGGNRKTYFNMLKILESMALRPKITALAAAVETDNWENMYLEVHGLKGACGYAGASRLHYACYFIQEAYHKKQWKLMIEKYPKLIESAIELIRYARLILAKHAGKEYSE